ncbi:histidinol-phosphatase [Caldanaerobius polysaccharolyticus]|uniref:histidinol-phosphatase n=1 Tax=Caldanaerobius polysaccharolyticus TaxID=44256 RepID=UPI00047A0B49|nr:histidinol-phosphatase [Caldanaerobius polysaccharolyticus]
MHYWDYHVHLENGPYTIEWLSEFVRHGQSRNVAEIGFSEHGYRFKQAYHLICTDGYRGSWVEKHGGEDIEEYIGLIEKAKHRGFSVKLGIELDYIPEKEEEIRQFVKQYPFDYVIGSIHWLGDWGIDLDPRDWEDKDVYDAYKRYFEILKQAAKSRIFSFLGHPDVIKVFGYKPWEDITELYEDAAKVIAENGQCVEVSTAGLRKPVGEMYPSQVFLEILSKYGVPVILNSDAHYPEHVGYMFDKGIDYIKKCGYTSLCKFEKLSRRIEEM